MALYSIWLLLEGLPVPIHSLEQLGLSLPEHELNRVELRRVGGQGDGHETPIPHEFLDQLASVNRGVVKDQYQLQSVLRE